MFRIQIPKPCHEDWRAMTPTQQGAFCTSCSKEVVDFTKLTDEEVQQYFLKNTTGKTCGRFRTEQVERIRIYLPENVLLQKMAGWKKLMAVFLLAFDTMLFGCEVGTQTTTGILQKTGTGDSGQIQKSASDTIQLLGEIAPTMGTPAQIKIDTISCTGEMLGAVVAPPKEDIEGVSKGEISIVPDTGLTPKTDTTNYDKVFTGGILLEKKADAVIKKPVSDTNKCNDTGYY